MLGIMTTLIIMYLIVLFIMLIYIINSRSTIREIIGIFVSVTLIVVGLSFASSAIIGLLLMICGFAYSQRTIIFSA